jgi:hypothetical protein
MDGIRDPESGLAAGLSTLANSILKGLDMGDG